MGADEECNPHEICEGETEYHLEDRIQRVFVSPTQFCLLGALVGLLIE